MCATARATKLGTDAGEGEETTGQKADRSEKRSEEGGGRREGEERGRERPVGESYSSYTHTHIIHKNET